MWWIALLVSFGGGVGIGLRIDEFGVSKPSRPVEPVQVIRQRRFDVLRVVDGDTFVVRYDGEPTKVRLLDIDTPERGKAGYDEATDVLRSLIRGRTVTLHFDADRKRDNFGRLLARVTVNGTDIGGVMLERGLAERYEPDGG